MIKLRLNAQHQIYMATVLVVTVLLLGSVLFFYSQHASEEIHRKSTQVITQQLTEQLDQRALSVARLLSRDLETPLYHYDIKQIYRLIENAQKLYSLLNIEVTDLGGNLLYDGKVIVLSDNTGHALADDIVKLTASSPYISYKQGNVLTYVHGVFIGNELLGSVVLQYSLDSIREDVASFSRNLEEARNDIMVEELSVVVIITTGLFILLLYLASRVTRFLTEPVDMLAATARRIGEGDYSGEVKLDRQDELGELASAFNKMLAQIRKHEQEIKRIAYHDPLTELPNRLLLETNIEQALVGGRQNNTFTALMFIDLDDFKLVNDTLGHDAGDLLLKQVASRISNCLRGGNDQLMKTPSASLEEKSSVSRLGGDEFTILAGGLHSRNDASVIAQRVIKTLKQPFEINHQKAVIGASIGIVIAPIDGDTVEILLKNADQAMYHAKGLGKNNFQYFDANLSSKISFVTKIKEDINKAILADQFELYYQPQVALATGELLGAEALIRWNHPEQGFLSPATFIPIAEDSRQITNIDYWVFNEVAQQIARWRKLTDKPFHIGANLSPQQLAHEEVIGVLQQVLEKYRISADDMHLEITETMLIKDEESAIQMLERLKDLGFSIWLDDFGTGFSSLSHLQQFPLSGIKIDRSFVMKLAESERDQSLAKSMITLAQTLDLDIIAEGVETFEQTKLLSIWGCNRAQGYYYGKPMPADEFERLLLSGSSSSDSSVVAS